VANKFLLLLLVLLLRLAGFSGRAAAWKRAMLFISTEFIMGSWNGNGRFRSSGVLASRLVLCRLNCGLSTTYS